MTIQTRLAHAPRWAAPPILAALGVLIAAGSLQYTPLTPAAAAARHVGSISDTGLYRAIEADVKRGDGYYRSAAREQRAHDYPVWPPEVVREPTEAYLLAALHTDILARGLLILLGVLAAASLWAALATSATSERERLWTLALGVAVLGACVVAGPTIYLHEAWASLFLLLSLTLRRDARWGLAVGAGLLACAFREIALPYLFVMAGYALVERRWREAAGWSGAIALFALLFGAHLALVAAQRQAGDGVSQGWMRFGGLGFVLATARANVLFQGLPNGLIAAALGVSAIGYAARRDRFIGRCAATAAAYVCLFSLVGRPENDYWGVIYGPLLGLGLALAPRSLRDLALSWKPNPDPNHADHALRALTSDIS
jgi:hypothetical protein